MTRVLYLMYTGLLEQGGDQMLNLDRLRDLHALGVRTWVAALELPGNLSPDRIEAQRAMAHAVAPSAEVLAFPRKAAMVHTMVQRLARLCREESVDLVAFTQAQSVLAVWLLRRETGVRVLWDCRASPDERSAIPCGPAGKARNALLRWAHRPAARVSDHVICVSGKHAEEMAGKWACDRSRITVVPNGVDIGAFRPDADARAAVRRELGLSDQDLVAVYSGSMQPWQCFPQSIEFFSLMASRNPGAFLLVLTPEAEAATAHLSRTAPQVRHVVLTVRHAEVPRYLAAADVGLLLRTPDPCNTVASPMKFAEYLACGVPVALGPQVGDYAELVQRECLGGIVHPDVRDGWEDAADGLLALLQRPGTDVSARCRATAVSLLSSGVERHRLSLAVDGALADG